MAAAASGGHVPYKKALRLFIADFHPLSVVMLQGTLWTLFNIILEAECFIVLYRRGPSLLLHLVTYIADVNLKLPVPRAVFGSLCVTCYVQNNTE